MKYVIGQADLTGYYYVATFSDEIIHGEVWKTFPPGCTLVGAGQVGISEGTVKAYSWSTSLNVGPGEIDDTILYEFLINGLSGLALANELAYE